MKKGIIIFGLACLSFWACNASAGTLTASQTGPGLELTFTPTSTFVPGAAPLVFTPSAQVNMAAQSVRTSFQLNAYHSAVLGKASGQGYGMAGDSKKVFFIDISPTGHTWVAVSGTNKTAFTGATAAWTSI